MDGPGLGQRAEDAHRHARRPVPQRGVADDRHAPEDGLDLLRQVPEHPVPPALAREARPVDRIQAGEDGLGKLGLQAPQVPARRQHLAPGVQHLEAHAQVGGQLHLGPGARWHGHSGHAQQLPSEGLVQGAPGRTQGFGAGTGEVGGRNVVPAGRARQRPDERRQLFLEEPRHQPVETRRVERGQQHQRHPRGHPVGLVARLEPVGQGDEPAARLEAVGEAFRPHPLRTVTHQLRARQEQALGVLGLDAPAPGLQLTFARHLVRDPLIVEGEDHLVVHQDVPPPRPVLQAGHLGEQRPIVREEGRRRPVVPFHEGRAQEHLPRPLRVDPPVVHGPARHQGQPVEGHVLERQHLARVRVPVRVGDVPPDQVLRGQRLDPGRVDRSGVAGKHARGLHQLRGHDPLRPLPR